MSTYSIGGGSYSGTSNVEIDDTTYTLSSGTVSISTPANTKPVAIDGVTYVFNGEKRKFIPLVGERTDHEKLMDACFNE
jgi:lipopolysaccharide export system protein LptA